MNELRCLPNLNSHIGENRENGHQPMGNGRIANRAILSRLVLLCLQLGSIPNHFFNTPYLYIIGISRNL